MIPPAAVAVRAEAGRLLATARKQAHVTQGTLAPLMHIRPSTLAHIERGATDNIHRPDMECDDPEAHRRDEPYLLHHPFEIGERGEAL